MATAGGAGSTTAWAALVVALTALGLVLVRGCMPGTGGTDEGSDGALTDLVSLENRLDAAEGRVESAEKRLQEVEGRLASVEKTARSALREALGATALAKAGGAAPTGVAAGADATVPEDAGERRRELDLVVAAIRAGTFSPDSVFQLVMRAKDLGGLAEAIAEVEKFAAAHPTDPALQVALGNAYTVKLLSVSDGPERGTWAARSLEAYENALRIDPAHWDAQYMKGFNLSQWPAFLGRQPEAIRTFERLIEQQERGAPDAKFAQTYFHLGNTYQAAGNLEKAKEVFRRGLELHPDSKSLREKMDVLEKR